MEVYVRIVTIKKKRNNNRMIVPDKQNADNNASVSAHETHRHVIIGPTNVGKTNYMRKLLGKLGNKRPIHIVIESPNQYSNFKTEIDIKLIDVYKGLVVNLMTC